MLVRLGSKSRNGWLAIDAFGGGGGEEREAGRTFENFRLLSLLIGGGKEEDEQCRSKRHRSGPFFIYI